MERELVGLMYMYMSEKKLCHLKWIVLWYSGSHIGYRAIGEGWNKSHAVSNCYQLACNARQLYRFRRISVTSAPMREYKSPQNNNRHHFIVYYVESSLLLAESRPSFAHFFY